MHTGKVIALCVAWQQTQTVKSQYSQGLDQGRWQGQSWDTINVAPQWQLDMVTPWPAHLCLPGRRRSGGARPPGTARRRDDDQER